MGMFWSPTQLVHNHGMIALLLWALGMSILCIHPTARAEEPKSPDVYLLSEPARQTYNQSPSAIVDLPQEARAVVDDYQKEANAIHRRADDEIDRLREKIIPRLKALQDEYCRALKLEEAIAVRDVIRHISGLDRTPAILKNMTTADIGRSELFEVTGSSQGAVWGSDVYTSDSSLPAAAVHAGVLKVGERGIVRVRLAAGQQSYEGSERNGVASQSYGPWRLSFMIERVKPANVGPDTKIVR